MDTSPDSQALPSGTHLHEFVIERVLGSGGFGITYLARDTSLGRQVVIKENLPAQFAWRETTTGTVRPRHSSASDAQDYEWSMQNFLREAETLASLDHPGIVRVLRKFETNGTAYFVMPFVDGVTFDSLIEERSSKNKPFSQDELLGLTTRMLAALGYLHQRNLYHRDIKPGNILITNEGVPVLIDFGSARQSLGERSLTVIESPGYTPFEQLQSHGNIGPWSDLYALGATLAKAITFRSPPKAADRMMGDPWHGLTGDPALSSYSDWFLKSIDRTMAVDPAHRWQSACEWTDFIDRESSMSGTVKSSVSQQIIPKVVEISHDHGTVSAIPYGLHSQGHISSIASKGGSSVINQSWEESYVESDCPNCGQRIRFQMKILKQKLITCPECCKETAVSKLVEFHSENFSPYMVSLSELLFSYKGRVGCREIWMLLILPQFVLSIAAYVMLASGVIVICILSLFIWVLWLICVCVPLIVKRLHDHGKSGYFVWLFIAFVCLNVYVHWIFGLLLIIYFGFIPGKKSPNKYGLPGFLTRNLLD